MNEMIVDAGDKIALRGDLGHDVAWNFLDYGDAAVDDIAAFQESYELVRNGTDDWWHTDGDLYQGTTLMRVIRRKSDGKLFGFSYWQGGGKHGEADVEHNGDDHGFPSKYHWEDGVDEDEVWYVFRPIIEKPIPAYVFAGEPAA
jgi:hypothetical protein